MIRLRAENITKAYGAIQALKGVSLDVHAGAVNVLIGENGAGKSTLMKIIAGIESPTSGRLLLDHREVAFASVREAATQGIGIVHQELNLCPNLTVAENIGLSAPRRRGPALDRAAERAEARQLLARLGTAIDPDAPVGSLRVGEQQLVEIARALREHPTVLILDEPTSALSTAEVEKLFAVIADLKASGVAIVYISHRLEELLRIGDWITVLRDGTLVETAPVADASLDWIVRRMLGQGQAARVRPGSRRPGEVVLALNELRVDRANGTALLGPVSVRFHAGEVTAIYGLLGAGRSELMEAIAGARPARGRVELCGKDICGLALHQRLAAGLQLVAEDRQAAGLFANLSVGRNAGMSVIDAAARRGWISAGRELPPVRRMIERLGIKAPSPAAPIGALSGGNQQKVLIGRALMPGPAAVLLDEPSRGVDIGARGEILARLRALAAEGMAVIYTTSDLEEALAAADRVLVLASGAITADLDAATASREDLVRAANAGAPVEAAA